MNKEQGLIWKEHDFSGVFDSVMSRAEQPFRIKDIKKALETPDDIEMCTYLPCEGGYICNFPSVPQLDGLFNSELDVRLKPSESNNETTVSLFESHECCDAESRGVPVEVNTSVIALKAYSNEYYDQKSLHGASVGSILLFTLSANLLSEERLQPSLKNVEFGTNCSYGVLATDNDIKYFKLNRNGYRVNLEELPSSSDEVLELQGEMVKFIESRQVMVDSDGEQ